MGMDVVKVESAGDTQYWGRLCKVCGQNYCVKIKFDYVTYANGHKSKQEAWRSSFCKCRFTCLYRNGEFIYRTPENDPNFGKFREKFENLAEPGKVGKSADHGPQSGVVD